MWILGDVTEFKDHHSSKLVNRFIDQLWLLRKETRINEVFILRGNHDGLDPDTPFFLFLRRIPWIHFFTRPEWYDHYSGTKVLVLPHTRSWAHDWATIDRPERAGLVLLHATVENARAESGSTLDGIPAELFTHFKAKILAGDVHVPQKVGRVEYVGAPYPIRFGDTFSPRAIGFPQGRRHDFALDFPKKAKVVIEHAQSLKRALRQLEVERDDQLKVELHLRESELGTWSEQKKQIIEVCERRGIHLADIELVRGKKLRIKRDPIVRKETHLETFNRYCKQQKIEKDLRAIGRELLKEDE